MEGPLLVAGQTVEGLVLELVGLLVNLVQIEVVE